MFEEVDTRSSALFYFRPLKSYCFHILICFPLALFVGQISEHLTRHIYEGDRIWTVLEPGAAVFTGFAAFGINWKRGDIAAAFVFVPPVLLFWLSWYDAVHYWSPIWSNLTHDEYVVNSLFGPSCGDQECLGTLGPSMSLPGVLYSVGALAALLIRSKRAH